jgi:hypothetical protein
MKKKRGGMPKMPSMPKMPKAAKFGGKKRKKSGY